MSNPAANEQALIGAWMLAPDLIGESAPYMLPSDFASPLARCAWEALCALHSRGEDVNLLSVEAEVRRSGSVEWENTLADLIEWEAAAPTRKVVPTLVRLVTEAATRRKLVRFAQDAEELATDDAQVPDEVVDELKGRLAAIDLSGANIPDRTVEVADLLEEPPSARATELVPKLLYSDTRTIIVAPEGIGKSYLLTQFAALASRGVHPLRFSAIEPIPVMVIDLENPRDVLRGRLDRLMRSPGTFGPSRKQLRLLSRPEGLDLRRRGDRLEVETALRVHRPALVTLGPLYKTYQRRDRETDETIAQELQNILDDLRTRYGFALMMEHHAPQSIAGSREIRPYGSSYWLRWPEIGIALSRKDGRDDVLSVSRWRGDRFPSDWPTEFERGTVFPFSGRWEK